MHPAANKRTKTSQEKPVYKGVSGTDANFYATNIIYTGHANYVT
jgi:hypothetical protein